MQGDVFLLQEVHLRDEEDVSAFTREWGGRRLEVIRELPGCLSTSRSLILGGDFNICLDVGRGGARAGEGGVDYSARALEGVVGDFGLTDAFRTVHPRDAGYTWRNSRGFASRLDYIFVGGGICGMKCVLLPSWASDHDMLQVSLPTDGPKWGSGFWRLNTLLLEAEAFKAVFTSFYRSARAMRPMYASVARAKALAFQARLRELEEGEKPSAYFFQAARARRSAPAFAGLKRPDGTVAEGSAMLAVAEAYYAELFSRRACDPVAEAALLDCVSARLESEEAQSMEADVSLEEVREALLSLRDGRSPGHDGCVRVNGFLSGPVEQLGGWQGCPLSPLLYVLFMEPFAELVRRDPGVDGGCGCRGVRRGSKVNLAKSSVLYCGCWRDDRSGGGFSVCTGGLKILGVRFFARDSGFELGGQAQPGAHQTGSLDPPSAVTDWQGRGGADFSERGRHGCYYFARFYLAGFFRHLVALSHVVPRSETPSPGYRSVLRFLRQCPSPVTREEATDHRALYARLASRQVVTPSGVPAGVVWSRVCGGGAPGAVRDLQWRCALGRLPVREILHRHGCAASPLCPRGCGAPETVSHVFWDCPFAGEFWTLVRGLLRRVGPGHVLSRDGVVYRRGLGLLPSVTSGVLWDVLGYAKWALWEDRAFVVGKRVNVLTPSHLFYRFRGRVVERIRMDRTVHGRNWVLERDRDRAIDRAILPSLWVWGPGAGGQRGQYAVIARLLAKIR
ncbi:hypothetical protein AAFF_G00040970 [Aldrovandia affinis]|uniref:Reverse transcriptase zinc-binding domain-containing protein n=1 Tax=Aldrovandia affinis TaxID=143900 RepID=A0AAD7R200_9TELE|nr:hypothetical protein AAFF_G00040970 [Aldrovandia affinis]